MHEAVKLGTAEESEAFRAPLESPETSEAFMAFIERHLPGISNYY